MIAIIGRRFTSESNRAAPSKVSFVGSLCLLSPGVNSRCSDGIAFVVVTNDREYASEQDLYEKADDEK